MPHPLAVRNAALKEAARKNRTLILDYITETGGATTPQITKALGIKNHTVNRWTKEMAADGAITYIKKPYGIDGKSIRVFAPTNRPASDLSHTAVIAKARDLPQPFASLVAQFI